MQAYVVEGQIVPYQSDLTIQQLPYFAPITRGQHNCIVSPSGITYLAKTSLKSSYLGSKYHAIDCHGTPWRKRGNLKRVMSGEPVKKKETPVETGVEQSRKYLMEKCSAEQISEYLSTLPGYTGPASTKLSTQQKRYRIKKSLVRNRLMAYVNSKIARGERKLFFVTVTFPKGMPDKLGVKCLNTWLTRLRKHRLVREYLWVAERQPKTNTIHFHIAVPHRVDIVKINGAMRTTLLNYAKEKVIPFPPSQFGRNEKGKEKYNGVDLAGWWTGGKQGVGVKIYTNFAEKNKTGMLVRYLTKYITKNNETFEHLAWHNSRGFSAVFHAVALTVDQVRNAGLAKYLHPDADKRFERFEVDENGVLVLNNKGKPIIEMLFVPWRSGAPEKFWSEINRVNNFFQDVEEMHKKLSKRQIKRNEKRFKQQQLLSGN